MVEEDEVLEGGPSMSSYYVEIQYLWEGAARDQLDTHADVLMEALMVEPNLIDPDVAINFETNAVDVCTLIDGDDEPDALRRALIAVRSAVHSIGVCTPDWQDCFEQVASTVRPSALAET
jgi:hypothetical protein